MNNEEFKLFELQKKLPNLEIKNNGFLSRGILTIPEPNEVLKLTDYIYQPYYTTFKQEDEEGVCLVDAGNIKKFNSEAVSRFIYLLKNKRIKFTSVSLKVLEAFSYIDMSIYCCEIDELVLSTVSGKNIGVKFDKNKTLEYYEKIIQEEIDICPDVFNFLIENIGEDKWI